MTSLARLPFRRLVRRLRHGLLHAAGPELRPALRALEPGDHLAQCGVIGAQRGIRLENLDNQLLEVIDRKNINICY